MSYICVFAGLYHSWPCVIVCFILQTITFTYAEISILGRPEKSQFYRRFICPTVNFVAHSMMSPPFPFSFFLFSKSSPSTMGTSKCFKILNKKRQFGAIVYQFVSMAEIKAVFSFNLTIKCHYSLQYPTTTTKCINIRTHYSSAKLS